MNLEFTYWTKEMRARLVSSKMQKQQPHQLARCQDNEVLDNGVCDNNTKKSIVKVQTISKTSVWTPYLLS